MRRAKTIMLPQLTLLPYSSPLAEVGKEEDGGSRTTCQTTANALPYSRSLTEVGKQEEEGNHSTCKAKPTVIF